MTMMGKAEDIRTPVSTVCAGDFYGTFASRTGYISGPDNFCMRMISSKNVIGVRTNQVGYLLNEEKRCTFSYNAGDVFDVVDSASGTIVYSGAIVNETADTNTGENEYYGDFTNVTTPGTYYIRSQIGIVSHVS